MILQRGGFELGFQFKDGRDDLGVREAREKLERISYLAANLTNSLTCPSGPRSEKLNASV